MTFDTSPEVRVGVHIFVANHCCASVGLRLVIVLKDVVDTYSLFADTRKHPLFISSLLSQLASFAILAQELSPELSKALLRTKILFAP